MRALFPLVILVGVASAAAAAPDAAIEPAVGAVAVPGNDDPGIRPVSLDEVDTTVTVAALRGVRGRPRRRVRVKERGRVLLALHTTGDDVLHLSIIEEGTGVVDDFAIGAADHRVVHDNDDGVSYPPRAGDNPTDDARPILFAIRALVAAGSTEARQVVVYLEGRSVRVVERALGSDAWSPRLRLDLARGTEVVAIGTTDPH